VSLLQQCLLIVCVTAAISSVSGCAGVSSAPSDPRAANAVQVVEKGSLDPDVARMGIMRDPSLFAMIWPRTFFGSGHPWYKFTGRPGEIMRLPDGDHFTIPPDELQPASASPDASSTCLNPNAWNGNVPPTCDNNGAFRRAYSRPAVNEGIALIQLPLVTTMPSPPPKNGDTGYIYIEGWPGPKTTNSEAGLQYSSVNHWYTLYVKPSTGTGYLSTYHFRAGDLVALGVQAFDEGPYPGSFCSGSTCIDGGASDMTPNCQPSGSYVCRDENLVNDPSWVNNCCIFARMTTMAQTPSNVFNDASKFGPVPWSGAELCLFISAANPSSCSLWTAGGYQNWPSDTTRVIVTNFSSTGETDEIDLHQ